MIHRQALRRDSTCHSCRGFLLPLLVLHTVMSGNRIDTNLLCSLPRFLIGSGSEPIEDQTAGARDSGTSSPVDRWLYSNPWGQTTYPSMFRGEAELSLGKDTTRLPGSKMDRKQGKTLDVSGGCCCFTVSMTQHTSSLCDTFLRSKPAKSASVSSTTAGMSLGASSCDWPERQ